MRIDAQWAGIGTNGYYNLQQIKYYAEGQDFEITTAPNGQTKVAIYIGGNPYTADIVALKDFAQTAVTYHYLHKDYLGNLLALTDAQGIAKEQRHFDPWGNLVLLKVNGTKITPTMAGRLLDRGYTGHEHLWSVGLIHMNGRLYDPLLRRFLQADEHIQEPYNTQNYNRYGYVLNNPLLYNDPSGEDPLSLGTLMLIAAATAIFATVAEAYYMKHPVQLGTLITNIVMAEVMCVVSYGVGTAMESISSAIKISSNFWHTVVVEGIRAGMHGITQGFISGVSGGDIMSGFTAGALSSAVGSGWQELSGGGDSFFGLNPLQSDTATVLFSTASGGVGAQLAGGNFWMGAAQGFAVGMFNHVGTKMKKSFLYKAIKKSGRNPEAKSNMSDSELAKFAKDVFGELFQESGSPSISYESNTSNLSEGFIITNGKKAYGITNGTGIRNDSNSIKIAPFLKNASFYDIGTVIGHELMHAYQNFNGFTQHYASIGARSGLMYNFKFGFAISEIGSYRFEEFLTGKNQTSMINYYKKIAKDAYINP